ncbi:hypothetical protein [Filimonas effusa]|uniref:Uncharacterized protein n=1 Tax=Filimonas effusa TaxID=2508721 RepID=A0A4Q1D8T0_9BACT|nr:hypothetical protein [Filimonas effusa]RXK85767.1 hypothetical protein ESB13_02835 [Filimonas effusa]
MFIIAVLYPIENSPVLYQFTPFIDPLYLHNFTRGDATMFLPTIAIDADVKKWFALILPAAYFFWQRLTSMPSLWGTLKCLTARGTISDIEGLMSLSRNIFWNAKTSE